MHNSLKFSKSSFNISITINLLCFNNLIYYELFSPDTCDDFISNESNTNILKSADITLLMLIST